MMMHSCGPDVPPSQNPGVALGLALGVAARGGPRQGHDFCVAAASPISAPGPSSFSPNSTGKNGKGLIPIDGEPLGVPEVYGDDRFFIDLRSRARGCRARRPSSQRCEKAGHPVVRIVQKSPDNIGQEFFRFEIATAVAGAVIGINPFDQPDVEASKIKTRELTAAFEKTGALPAETPVVSEQVHRCLYRRRQRQSAARRRRRLDRR